MDRFILLKRTQIAYSFYEQIDGLLPSGDRKVGAWPCSSSGMPRTSKIARNQVKRHRSSCLA